MIWTHNLNPQIEYMGKPQTTLISAAAYRELDSVQTDWLNLEAQGAAHHIFQTFEWTRAWWDTLGTRGQARPRVQYGGGDEPGNMMVLKVEDGGRVTGLVPLLDRDDATTLLGDKDVCDYLDAMALPGHETGVAGSLLEHLQSGQRSLDLLPLRPDSFLQQCFLPLATVRGCGPQLEAMDVSFDLPLPCSWDEYLKILKRDYRHELRRKLRNLYAAGKVAFYSRAPNPEDLDDFFRLFRISRHDKMAFMTPAREAFFRRLGRDLGGKHRLQLSFLELDGVKVATAWCFDYNNTISLYNSGYDPDYAPLSVGLLCKAMTIREAIEKGRSRYDFLRGAEDYKFRLGGAPFPIHRIIVSR